MPRVSVAAHFLLLVEGCCTRGGAPRLSRFHYHAFALTGASSVCVAFVCFSSGASYSQTHPSLMQVYTVPIFVYFSTTNGAPHFGQGCAIGMLGEVKSQSG